MAHYNCMLIDLDNTLLDFDAAEASALAATLAHFELPGDAQTIAEYRAINEKLWREFERGEHQKRAAADAAFFQAAEPSGQAGQPGEDQRLLSRQSSPRGRRSCPARMNSSPMWKTM